MLLMLAATPPAAAAVIVRLPSGRAGATAALVEPAGVIRVYRISAPVGDHVTAWVRLPGRTVPLEIRTVRFAATSSCRRSAARVLCSVGEEWCPVPAGVWRVRIRKRAGPGGPIRVRLVVGSPA